MGYTEKFMISHTFQNVEHGKLGGYSGPRKTINEQNCYIFCMKTNESNWHCCLNGVETVGTTDGRIENSPGITLQDDPKYFVNGNMRVECYVEVYEVDENGIRIPPRLFDESVKEYSDVVLIVEEKKFYVNKLYLASESSFFKYLFIGSFEESKKDEISLKDVEAKYFQLFLESLYGDPVINGILPESDQNCGRYSCCNVRESQGNGSRRVGIPFSKSSFSS
ncbi:hypothetical protein CRE_26722 [Caenorhabditis remanei]|uniref:BTB domain-containing protein n=1 Tax=Caenorhabditis remanei TaxID=31234 RepID=E3MXV5_CAERE|nr:hypothetical protein CRE_26722 [Caenorhabditis remanei]